MSSPLRLGVRMSWRPVTVTERTGTAGIPMIGTIPFRRTGRGAPCGPRPPGPLTCAGRAVRHYRLKDNRSAERRHRRICWPDETRAGDGRHLVDPGGDEHRRGWTHMMINPTGPARHPAPVRTSRQGHHQSAQRLVAVGPGPVPGGVGECDLRQVHVDANGRIRQTHQRIRMEARGGSARKNRCASSAEHCHPAMRPRITQSGALAVVRSGRLVILRA